MEKFDFDFNEDDEQLVRLKTPAEIKQDKRNEINRIVKELHNLEAEFFRKKQNWKIERANWNDRY